MIDKSFDSDLSSLESYSMDTNPQPKSDDFTETNFEELVSQVRGLGEDGIFDTTTICMILECTEEELSFARAAIMRRMYGAKS